MQAKVKSILAVLLTAAVLGCTTLSGDVSQTSLPGKTPSGDIQPLIEKLLLNHKSLEQIYQDLRLIAEGTLFYGSDEQLNYIQKACLYVQLADLTAQHQWDGLSLMDYIQKSRLRDFYTLKISGLKQALFESAYQLNFLNTYQASIDNKTALDDIEAAVDLIRDNMDIFQKLIAALTPLANPDRPADRI
jgi:hypothetical protein